SLVLTHCQGDAHQDHRLIAELTHNTFRDHLILEYEIPKHDGDLGNPGLFMPLSETLARRKAASLVAHFKSQQARRWFAEDTFLALMRLRGAFSGAPSRSAVPRDGVAPARRSLPMIAKDGRVPALPAEPAMRAAAGDDEPVAM